MRSASHEYIEDESLRPATRKRYRACETCASAKIRCDDVRSDGCLECRRRNRQCSIVHAISECARVTALDGDHTSSFSSYPSSNVEHRLSLLESQISSLRDEICPSYESSRHSSLPFPIRPLPTRCRASDLSGQIGRTTSGRRPTVPGISRVPVAPFDERICTTEDLNATREMAMDQEIPSGTLAMAREVVVLRYQNVFPLSRLLIVAKESSAPLVNMAILTCVSEELGLSYVESMTAILAQIATGLYQENDILALLLLSLCPLQADSARLPSPVRAIGIAYELGKSLGLEALSRGASQHLSRLHEDIWSDLLSRILLWELVKTQYNILHLACTRCDGIVQTYGWLFDSTRYSAHSEAITFLQCMASFNTTVESFVRQLADAEAAIAHSTIDLDVLFAHWTPVVARSETTINQHPQTALTIRCIVFSLSLRLSIFVQLIPTPLDMAHKSLGHAWNHWAMLRAACELVYDWLASDYAAPRWIITVIVTAVVCVRRYLNVRDAIGGRLPEFVAGTRIDEADVRIRSMGGPHGMILQNLLDGFSQDGSAIRREFGLSDEITTSQARAPNDPTPQDTGEMFDPLDLGSLFNNGIVSFDVLLESMSQEAFWCDEGGGESTV